MIPVLLYHSVSDDGDAYAVGRAQFREHVRAIAASGAIALDITTLARGLGGERPLPARAVAVTFDDGFADTLDAVEQLARAGVVSTVYVTSGYVGRPGMLSSAGVAELGAAPAVELGAHGVLHLRLDELPVDAIDEELTASRARLEDLVQTPVRSFAYPHGAYDRRVRARTAAARYASAAAVKNALSHAGDDPLAIARWTVMRDTPAARVAAVLEGRGAPLAWHRERLRTRGWRHVRRARRRVGGVA